MAIIERIKGILTEPRAEWPKIAAEPATTQGIYAGWVMILAAIGPLATLIGFAELGAAWALRFAVGSYVISLAITFVLAMIVDTLAPSFGGQKDFVAALKLVAYSYTAAWLAGIAQVLGHLGGIVVLLASIYAWYTFFLGAPVLRKCSADKAIPFTLVIVLCGIALGVIAGMALSGAGFTPGMMRRGV
ncbi:hypothetical protein BURK1_00758 [Burkholderiales bacterium]|nr:hypothetical protein BURK1_00758 [Burkholderiales bacterium]